MKRKDPKHEAFIRDLMCMRCGSMMDIQCAHIRRYADAGAGLKSSARYCAPLCHRCHIIEQHNTGELTFWGGEAGVRKAFGFTNALYEISGDVFKGNMIVSRGRREIWA